MLTLALITALYRGERWGMNFLPSSESEYSNLAVCNAVEECEDKLSLSLNVRFSGSTGASL